MKTTMLKSADIKRDWHLIDLNNQVLGRVATEIASKLTGKYKPNYTPHMDNGDYVVVINAQSVAVTGTKRQNKLYQHHSLIPGGFKQINFEDLMSKDPRKVISHAIAGMLPKNKLRADRLKRLKIFVDDQHPYQKQIEQSKKAE
jgi:large subunit ribosomal protein L13